MLNPCYDLEYVVYTAKREEAGGRSLLLLVFLEHYAVVSARTILYDLCLFYKYNLFIVLDSCFSHDSLSINGDYHAS